MRNGFTLIELSIVITIIALLMVGLLKFLGTLDTSGSYRQTEAQLDHIQEAMALFYKVNGRLPCPATRTAAVSTAAYGIETDCTAAAPAGTVDATATTEDVRIGVIPTRSLNLPDKILTDQWGNRITYAVMKDMGASTTSYTASAGEITVNDSGGNALSNPASSVAYVLISHGKDGRGSWLRTGAAHPIACGSTTMDSDNCDDDTTFIDTWLYDGDVAASYYDDIIRWQTKPQIEWDAVN